MVDGLKLTVKKDELYARLRRLVPAATEQMGVANHKSAEDMADTARSFVPVKTGALRSSIRVTEGPRPGSFYVKAGGPATTKGGFDYALAAEFGTSQHTNGGLFRGSINPGEQRRSFFWPSYRLMKKRIKSRAATALRKAIKAVVGT